jgi:hypothetical protein
LAATLRIWFAVPVLYAAVDLQYRFVVSAVIFDRGGKVVPVRFMPARLRIILMLDLPPSIVLIVMEMQRPFRC